MKVSTSLIGLMIISLAAFFGFGAILSDLEMDIGKQAVAAAFGALFIILSTKFLMEQEASSQKEYDQKRKIFERRISIFSDSLKLINSVLEDDVLDKDELNRLRGLALELHLSANKEALEAYTKFLEKCVEIFTKSSSQNDRVVIDEADHKECWKLAADFVVSCREGLNLPQEDSSVGALVAAFADILQQVDDAVSLSRAPLEGGLQEFAEIRSWHPDDTQTLAKFNDFILQSVPELRIKYTKNMISYSNKSTDNRAKVVFYVKQMREHRVICSFAARHDKAKVKEVADHVNADITPYAAQSKNMWGFELRVKPTDSGDLDRLMLAIEKYKSAQDEGLA